MRVRNMLLVAAFALFSVQLGKGLFFPPSSPLVFWAIDLANFVIAPAIAVVVLRQLGVSWKELLMLPDRTDVRAPAAWKAWFAAFAVTFAVFLLIAPIVFKTSWYQELKDLWPRRTNYQIIVASSGDLKPLVLFHFASSAGIIEEVVYRNWMARWFLDRGRGLAIAYVVISALLFGAVHWTSGAHNIFFSTIVGVGFAWVAVRYRRLLPLVVMHFLTDWILFG